MKNERALAKLQALAPRPCPMRCGLAPLQENPVETLRHCLGRGRCVAPTRRALVGRGQAVPWQTIPFRDVPLALQESLRPHTYALERREGDATEGYGLPGVGLAAPELMAPGPLPQALPPAGRPGAPEVQRCSFSIALPVAGGGVGGAALLPLVSSLLISHWCAP